MDFIPAFQNIGLNNKKYTPLIQNTGMAFSIIIPFNFCNDAPGYTHGMDKIIKK